MILDQGRELPADRFSDGQVDLEQEARPVFDRSAVRVLAPVVSRGEELAQQKAVRRVDLDAVETRLHGPERGFCERCRRCLDVFDRHFPARRRRQAFEVGGNEGRLPGRPLVCEVPGMGDLCDDSASGRMDRLRQFPVPCDQRIGVYSDLGRRSLSLRSNEAVTRNYQSDPAFRQVGHALEQLRRYRTVLRRQSFPRGRPDKPVCRDQPADLSAFENPTHIDSSSVALPNSFRNE